MQERVDGEVAHVVAGAGEGEEVGDVEVGEDVEEEFVGEVGEEEERGGPWYLCCCLV